MEQTRASVKVLSSFQLSRHSSVDFLAGFLSFSPSSSSEMEVEKRGRGKEKEKEGRTGDDKRRVVICRALPSWVHVYSIADSNCIV